MHPRTAVIAYSASAPSRCSRAVSAAISAKGAATIARQQVYGRCTQRRLRETESVWRTRQCLREDDADDTTQRNEKGDAKEYKVPPPFDLAVEHNPPAVQCIDCMASPPGPIPPKVTAAALCNATGRQARSERSMPSAPPRTRGSVRGAGSEARLGVQCTEQPRAGRDDRKRDLKDTKTPRVNLTRLSSMQRAACALESRCRRLPAAQQSAALLIASALERRTY